MKSLFGSQKKLPFVGRGEEISLLLEEFQSTTNYAGRFILIRGEAGSGKTRLLQEFLSLPQFQTAWVLTARAVQGESSILSPFPRLLSENLARVRNKTEFLAKYVEPFTLSPLSEIIPDLKQWYPFEVRAADKPEDPRGLVNALYKLFTNLALTRPLVIAIDDIHWLADDSLDFLKFLTLRVYDKPIFIIGSAYPGQRTRTLAATIAALFERRLLRIVNLQNLSRPAVDDLLDRLFGPAVPLPFKHWLYTKTVGNPLFIEEVIRALTERNILRPRPDGWEVLDYYQDFPLTENLRAVIKTRLARLEPAERKFLEKTSVLGGEFEPGILKNLSAIPEPGFSLTLRRFQSQQIFEFQHGVFSFSHPLLREVIYSEMEPSQRRLDHRQIARLLNRSGGTEEAIAYHLTKDLESKEETASLCRRLLVLADGLVKKYRAEEAYRCASLAGRIARKFPRGLKREGLRAEFLILRFGPITGRSFSGPEDHLAAARKLERGGLTREAAQMLLVLSRNYSYRLDFKQAEKCRRRALSILMKLRQPKKEHLYWNARAEECTLLRRKGDYRQGRTKAENLLAELPPKFFSYSGHIASTTLGVIAEREGNLDQAFRYYAQSLKIAEEGNRTDGMAVAYTNLGIAFQARGQLDQALANFRKALDINTSIGDAGAALNTINHLGEIFFAFGELPTAVRYLSQTIDESKQFGFYNLIASSLLPRAKAYFYQGNLDRARADIESLIALSRERKVEEETLGFTKLLKSRILLEERNYPEALRSVARVHDQALKKNLPELKMAALLLRCLVLARSGKTNPCRQLLKPLIPQAIEDPLLFTELGIALRDGTITRRGFELLIQRGAEAWSGYLIRQLEDHKLFSLVKFVRGLLSPDPRTLKIYTFGGLTVQRPGEEEFISAKEWGSKKAKELLGLILVLGQKTGVTRETLSSHLWPKMSGNKSRLNFNFTMSQLRKALSVECIIFDGTFYKLNSDATWVDCFQFETLYQDFQLFVRQGKLHPAEAKARAAWELYRGDFLPEMYELPIDDHQLALRTKVKSLLEWLGARARERLDWDEVMEFGQRLLRLEPLNESAHSLIMESLLSKGDRAGALRQFERLREMMRKELKAAPGSEITAFYNKIKTKV